MPRLTAEEAHQLGLADPANPSRVIGGALAQAGGRSFETELEVLHAYLEVQGIATIRRLPVETAPIPRAWMKDPRKGGMCRILSQRQQCDYFGYLHGTGRAVMMEAKSLGKAARSLPIIAANQKGSGLKEHQLRSLAEAHHAGALAALVWRNGPGSTLVIDGIGLAAIWDKFRIGTERRIDRSLGGKFADPDGRRGLTGTSPLNCYNWLHGPARDR